ncbi:MAG TPA: S16 family serine protease, partial [bacterium]|nr:S16 family serine protease [bacterium]
GGFILQVEATAMEGRGKLTLTGQLGSVMQESAQAALSWVRSNAVRLGIDPGIFQKMDIHIHVPAGATPKDGPSAGVTMTTALVSLLTGLPVDKEVAMTGEISLRGEVLPIGGLKEKLLAAVRGKLHTAIIPEDNVLSLQEVDEEVKKYLKIHPVDRLEEVLRIALGMKDFADIARKAKPFTGAPAAERPTRDGQEPPRPKEKVAKGTNPDLPEDRAGRTKLPAKSTANGVGSKTVRKRTTRTPR